MQDELEYDCAPPVDHPTYCDECGETEAIGRVLRLHLFNGKPLGDAGLMLAGIFRNALAMRAPLKHMLPMDRDKRLAKIIEFLIRDGIVRPLSKDEARALGVKARVDGSALKSTGLGQFAPSCRPAWTPPEGWAPHPSAPGWFYRGQEVLSKAQLRGLAKTADSIA